MFDVLIHVMHMSIFWDNCWGIVGESLMNDKRQKICDSVIMIGYC